MIITISAILLILIITSIICYFNTCEEDLWSIIGGVASFLFILSLVILFICIGKLISFRVIDDKIELYKKQNKNIEEKIELVVKEYKDFEKDTFTNLKADSYITLVNLYPELKSDEMVKRQIDLYEKNNEKITTLKEEKINRTIYRWWVYFGK